jgi:hypothetical protein
VLCSAAIGGGVVWLILSREEVARTPPPKSRAAATPAESAKPAESARHQASEPEKQISSPPKARPAATSEPEAGSGNFIPAPAASAPLTPVSGNPGPGIAESNVPEHPLVARVFAVDDRNADGVISREEAGPIRIDFDRIDADGSGTLDRAECAKFFSRPENALGGPVPPPFGPPPGLAGAGREPRPAAPPPMARRIRWRTQASNDPGRLGAFLNLATLPEFELKTLGRRQDRNGDALKSQLDQWAAALTAANAPADRQAILINLFLLDPLYVADDLQLLKANAHLKRIASLDQPIVERWQKAYGLSAVEAVWDLIQVDALFEGETFLVSAAEEMLAGAEKELAEELEKGRLRAAERAKELEAEKAEREAAEAARLEKIELAKSRTWVSAGGTFTIEAKFIAFSAGVVTLEKKDGTKIQVPIDKLADEDQQFIRERKWLKVPAE